MSTKKPHKKTAKPKLRPMLAMPEISNEISKAKVAYEDLKKIVSDTETHLGIYSNDIKDTGDRFAEEKNALISIISSTLENIYKCKGIIEMATNVINSLPGKLSQSEDALSASMSLAETLVNLHEEFTTTVSIPYQDITLKIKAYFTLLRDHKEFPFND